MALERSPDVISEVVDGRAMLVSPDGSEVLSLNAVGTMVWERLDEQEGDVGRLADALLVDFEDVSREQLVRDIGEFVETLRAEGLARERVG